MTTFHDILGTEITTQPADVKRRYKLLSSRCHPDKEGSKALMQLISQSYDKVMNGKGMDEAVMTTVVIKKAVSDEALKHEALKHEALKTKYRQLDAQYKLLKIDNDTLTQQLDNALKQLQKASAANQSANAGLNEPVSTGGDARYKQVLERDNLALRRENRQLQTQLDNMMRRESASSQRYTATGNPTTPAKGTKNAAAGAISPTVLKQLRGLGENRLLNRGVAALLIVLVVAGLVSAARAPLEALWLSVTVEDAAVEQEVLTILHMNPEDHAQQKATSTKTAQVNTPTVEKADPLIRLRGESGIWTLSQFENTLEPYISVRSDKGSYIVKTCHGDFQYYKNMSVRSGRLAANLMFERMDRHFEVYNIPYGNGSFVMNWTESKSLLINNEYFPNLAFEQAYSDLQQQCL
ncbi:J domain-containing protein [Photobacterium japonica]|uniref:J domain-containing protein n=1 Tax=Photobacterium japonica TaxID=2910235 RepID=UPI003D0F5115